MLQAAARRKVACPHANAALLRIQGREERQAGHMIDMKMAEEDIEIGGLRLVDKPITERPKPGSSIEDQDVIAATHFNAWRIAAIARCVLTGTSNAAADPPETNRQGGGRPR